MQANASNECNTVKRVDDSVVNTVRDKAKQSKEIEVSSTSKSIGNNNGKKSVIKELDKIMNRAIS